MASLRRNQYTVGVAWAVRGLACVAQSQNKADEAAAMFRESLRLLISTGRKMCLAACLEGLAATACREPPRAGVLLGAASALRDAYGTTAWLMEEPLSDHFPDSLPAQIGQEETQSGWAEGRAMTAEQAVAYALEGARETGEAD
jgi:hypothetical protein